MATEPNPFKNLLDFIGGLVRGFTLTPTYDLDTAFQNIEEVIGPSRSDILGLSENMQRVFGRDFTDQEFQTLTGLTREQFNSLDVDEQNRRIYEHNLGGGRNREGARNAAVLYAELASQAQGELTAQDIEQSFGGLNDLLSYYGNLASTPFYSPQEIEQLVGKSVGDITGLLQSNIKTAEEQLAARGFGARESGLAEQLSNELRAAATEQISTAQRDIPFSAEQVNAEYAQKVGNVYNQLAGLNAQVQGMLTNIRGGQGFDISSLFNTLSGLGGQVAGTDFLNQSLTQQAIFGIKNDIQQGIENLLSLYGIQKGGKGGGGGRKPGFSGSLGFSGSQGINAGVGYG